MTSERLGIGVTDAAKSGVNDRKCPQTVAVFNGAALASNQRRLRGLRQLICRNIVTGSGAPSSGQIRNHRLSARSSCSCYFTVSVLLRSGDCSEATSSCSCQQHVVYTSECCWLSDGHAIWEPLDVAELVTSGGAGDLWMSNRWLVVRVYLCDTNGGNEQAEQSHSFSPSGSYSGALWFTWRVYLPALVPVCLEWPLADNTLVFSHNGQWLTAAECVIFDRSEDGGEGRAWWRLHPPLSVEVASDTVISAADTTLLERLHRCQHERYRLESSIQQCRVQADQMWSQVRQNHNQTAVLFRRRRLLQLLRREVAQRRSSVLLLNERLADLQSRLTASNSLLHRRTTALADSAGELDLWRRQSLAQLHQLYLQQHALLNHRRRQLCQSLQLIYPIRPRTASAQQCSASSTRSPNNTQPAKAFTILNLHLPDADQITGTVATDRGVSVALSHVCQVLCMLSLILGVTLRYPIERRHTEIVIRDHILARLPENERLFSVTASGKDLRQFSYAVYLLNKNIAQLRTYCCLETSNLRAMLANLSGLMDSLKSPVSSYDNEPFSSAMIAAPVISFPIVPDYIPSAPPSPTPIILPSSDLCSNGCAQDHSGSNLSVQSSVDSEHDGCASVAVKNVPEHFSRTSLNDEGEIEQAVEAMNVVALSADVVPQQTHASDLNISPELSDTGGKRSAVETPLLLHHKAGVESVPDVDTAWQGVTSRVQLLQQSKSFKLVSKRAVD